MPVTLKKIFKKIFPKLYYSEKIQKYWYYLMAPTPIKFVILLIIALILIVIFSSLSSDDVGSRLNGFNVQQSKEVGF